MASDLPDPSALHPVTLRNGTTFAGTVHLSHVAESHPKFEAGAFSYASDFDPPATPAGWVARMAPYLMPFSRESLHIGKFCQIAHGVRFVTAWSNHAMGGVTTYPFFLFDQAEFAQQQADTRDTVIGHDVWIGYGALILPGAQIGDGAIIGAGAVVRGTIPAYAVAIGNPATVIRHRYGPAQVAELRDLAWWDWPPEVIAAARPALETGDLQALRRLRPAAGG